MFDIEKLPWDKLGTNEITLIIILAFIYFVAKIYLENKNKKSHNTTQNHNDNGDNIVGNKTVNNTYNISNQNETNNILNLSNEAVELLEETSKSKSGVISVFHGMSETIIKVNNRNFTEDNTARTSAKYKSALAELTNNYLLDMITRESYQMTQKGYKYIDSIAKI